MARQTTTPTERSSAVRRVFVSSDDVAAAERILNALAAQQEQARPGGRDSADEGRLDATQAVQEARQAYDLRERRIAQFGFSAEPPFQLLLALYVHEEWEPAVTIGRLTQLAGLSPTTALRWLDVLIREGWLSRTSPKIRRNALITLSRKARDEFCSLYSWKSAPDKPR